MALLPEPFAGHSGTVGIPLTAPAARRTVGLTWRSDRDLTRTAARWKLVCYHVPAFQASKQHYAEQQTRQLQPLFEACGVDLCFAGHVHNYQRTVPIRFAPDAAGLVKGKVNGNLGFTVSYSMAKDSKNKQAAWTLLSWLTGKVGMSKWMSLGLALPSRSDVKAA